MENLTIAAAEPQAKAGVTSQSLNGHLTAKQQELLSKAKVCILGAGGLGSNIAFSLARMGVTQLRIIDFDRVEPSNLNRQAYMPQHLGQYKAESLVRQLQTLLPPEAGSNFEAVVTKITEANIHQLTTGCDYIVEALDNPEAKAMVIGELLSQPGSSIIVGASGMAGFGSGNEITAKRITKRLYLCGDGSSDVADLPLCGPRVILCAAQQALTLIRLILKMED